MSGLNATFFLGIKPTGSLAVKIHVKYGVFPMVVVSLLPHVECGRNDHWEEAPHFISQENKTKTLIMKMIIRLPGRMVLKVRDPRNHHAKFLMFLGMIHAA